MTLVTDRPLVGNRYQLLEELGRGGMGVVYRAIDRLSGQQVALKQVTAPSDELIAGSKTESGPRQVALAQEFQALATLRHPNIISVLDYGFDREQQPFFTMEVLSQPRTLLEAGRGEPLGTKLGLLVQTLQAFAYLHRRGTLHRDVKPSNVLVSRGQVKLVDFGLAATPHAAGGLAGTVAYMAPEVLAEEAVGPRVDLFAVGVLAYELLVGHHPYPGNNPAAVMQQILTAKPDLRPLAHAAGGAPVTPIIAKLLTRHPADSYHDADEVIRELCAAFGQTVSSPSVAVRESFLVAARFVGRAQELGRLSLALAGATKGQGSAWLIGGESGVGKSRLLQELRIRAMVAGVPVLNAQAHSEGEGPYAIWREPLRRLLLLRPVDDRLAGALCEIVPDIELLLGREVPAAPEVPPEANQKRLLAALEEVFQQAGQPLLLILEDLHWGGPETLDVLRRLAGIATHSPLLVVGSYRDDERSELAYQLADFRHMPLRRLGNDSIRELSASILGEGGRYPPLVDLLVRETEGNAFFLVEAARALAEELGSGLADPSRLAAASLPQRITTGGLRRAVERRLARLPKSALPLLRCAAVSGRRLDPLVLDALSDGSSLDSWLRDCSEAAVIEAVEGDWRFSHDKLREAVLAGIDPVQRKAIHRRVAAAIEAVHSDTPERIEVLAHHFVQGEEWEAAAAYLRRAGNAAGRVFAYDSARRHFTLALDALSRLPDTPRRRRQVVEIILALTQASLFSDSPDKNLERLAQGEALLRRVADEASRGVADHEATAPHDPAEANRHGVGQRRANRGSGAPPPPTIAARLVAVSADSAANAPPPTDESSWNQGDLLLLARLRHAVGRAYYLRNQNAEAISHWRRVLAVADQIEDEELQALPAAVIGRALVMNGQYGKGMALLTRALEPLEQLGNWQEWIATMGFMGIAIASRGQFAEGLAAAERGLAKAREIGTLNALAAGHSMVCFTHFVGRNLVEMKAEALAMIGAAEQSGDQVFHYLAHGFAAIAEMRAGNFQAADAAMTRSVAIANGLGGQLLLAGLFAAARADIALLAGKHQEALAQAAAAAAGARSSGSLLSEGLAERTWALALAATGADASSVDAHFETGIHALDAGEAIVEGARVRLSWARLCRLRGDHVKAAELTREASGRLTAAGLAPDVE